MLFFYYQQGAKIIIEKVCISVIPCSCKHSLDICPFAVRGKPKTDIAKTTGSLLRPLADVSAL